LCSVAVSVSKAVAAQLKSATTHIQKLRDGTAQLLVDRVQATINEQMAASPIHDILQFSIDCTTESMRCGRVIGPQQVFLMLGKYATRTSTGLTCTELLCPTLTLQEENAECLLAAVRKCLPQAFDIVDRRRVLILNSDSHKANKRLFRYLHHFVESNEHVFALHSFCVMHMTCASLAAVLGGFNIISGAFCATLQLHKGSTMSDLQDKVHSYINDKLEIEHEWDERWNSARQRNRTMISLFMRDDSFEPNESKHIRYHLELLLNFLPDLWWNTETGRAGRLVHFCAFGCCNSREESLEQITSCVDASIFACRPTVPALNRWTRLFQPLSWWGLGLCFFGLVPAAFADIQPADDEPFQVTLQDLFASNGLDDTHYKAREGTRWRKAVSWMSAPDLLPRLMLILAVMTPPMDLMTDIFKTDKNGLSALQFATSVSSPVQACNKSYFQLLQNQRHRLWQPFAPIWTHSTLALAFKTTMMTAGNLFLRCLRPFRRWHWSFALLVNPHVPSEHKDLLLDRLSAIDTTACPRCLDTFVSTKLHKLQADGVDLRSPEMTTFLKDMYSSCPCNNVQVETRFGRQRNFAASSMGRDRAASSMASTHILAEMTLQHGRSALRWNFENV